MVNMGPGMVNMGPGMVNMGPGTAIWTSARLYGPQHGYMDLNIPWVGPWQYQTGGDGYTPVHYPGYTPPPPYPCTTVPPVLHDADLNA